MDLMSERQWKRVDVVERLNRGALTGREARQLLSVSERQLRRIRRGVRAHGAAGVRHGNAGRVPVHRVANALRRRMVELRRTKYDGFNDQHFTENLQAVEGIEGSR